MKRAFSRPTVDDAEQQFLFTSFRTAGFDGLQLKAGQYKRYLSEPDRFLADWGQDPAAVSALIAGGTLDPAGIAILRRTIAFAQAIGSERIVFCHSVPRRDVTPADLRQFASILTTLAREAQDQGLCISLHHHYDQPVMHREDFRHFFDAASKGPVGLTLDTAHLVKSGIDDIAGVIREFRDVIDNVHLKDYADGQFKVLGEGAIEFGPVFQALEEASYDGWLCGDEESGGDLRKGMEASFRFLQSWAGIAGSSTKNTKGHAQSLRN